jgi:hypothetical protein
VKSSRVHRVFSTGAARRGNIVSAMSADVDRIVRALPVLPERGEEFRYASLPLCILDAVFSIGVRYESVQAVVRRYAPAYELPLHRAAAAFPAEDIQANVGDLVRQIEAVGSERAGRLRDLAAGTVAATGQVRATAGSTAGCRGRARPSGRPARPRARPALDPRHPQRRRRGRAASHARPPRRPARRGRDRAG